MPQLKKTMFREYDIRGRGNDEELNPRSAEWIGRGFGTYLARRNIEHMVVGEAKACLLGDPYEHKNLELLDTETYEFKSYFWHSLYKTKVEDYDYEKSEDYNRDRKVTITEKYPQRGQEPEVIETRANEIYNRKSGKEYALYRAGWWDWRCDED